MGHSCPLKPVPSGRCPSLRTSWHCPWVMQLLWKPQCKMMQEPVVVLRHPPQTHQPHPQDPSMPSPVPQVSRKQMRQHVQTSLRGRQWMMSSQKQGRLVPWRPEASRITKVGSDGQFIPLLQG